LTDPQVTDPQVTDPQVTDRFAPTISPVGRAAVTGR
jgi:hypothetical protein